VKRINNPYTRIEGYCCFACSPDNTHGLRMEFMEDGEEVVSFWNPEDHFQGYHNILHGGIQATLMDEIASWIIQVKLRTGGVTASMETRFKKPVFTNHGPLTVRARIESAEKRLVRVKTSVYNNNGDLGSEGMVTYFIFPEKIARKQLAYPGY
jgi:uncharacterized protein (TIGR00369 family)